MGESDRRKCKRKKNGNGNCLGRDAIEMQVKVLKRESMVENRIRY